MKNLITRIDQAISRFIIDQGHIGRSYQARTGRKLSAETHWGE